MNRERVIIPNFVESRATSRHSACNGDSGPEVEYSRARGISSERDETDAPGASKMLLTSLLSLEESLIWQMSRFKLKDIRLKQWTASCVW